MVERPMPANIIYQASCHLRALHLLLRSIKTAEGGAKNFFDCAKRMIIVLLRSTAINTELLDPALFG